MFKTIKDVATYTTMSFFFCNITEENYKDVYKDLNKIDSDKFNPEDFFIWEPFVDYFSDLEELLFQIDKHIQHFEQSCGKWEGVRKLTNPPQLLQP